VEELPELVADLDTPRPRVLRRARSLPMTTAHAGHV
jgi:hypothetical protein